MFKTISLSHLGWQPFFQQQLQLDEWSVAIPARVVEYHKSEFKVVTETGYHALAISQSMPALTVGDWILLDSANRYMRLLERKSCFRRKAAGSKVSEQLIAANIDTAFIVCSLNDDFNLNRIERYLSVAYDAGAEPVVVLSKVDLCDDADSFRLQVQQLDNRLCVEMLNGLNEDCTEVLMPWCQLGKTIVMLGSSGVGKSTLTNHLLGESFQAIHSVREDDDKGRHTTTRRSLIIAPNGAMIIDTPGMRELQLADCEEGVAEAFADIEALSNSCRFSDCSHDSEPSCAVLKAVELGQLDMRRLNNYRKLLREQSFNRASLAERRASDKKLGQYYSRVLSESKHNKRG